MESESEIADDTTAASEHTGEGDGTQENQQENGGERPSYAPRVDLSSIPEEFRGPIENRFKHLSHLMKKQGGELNEYRNIAKSQSDKIEELMGGMGQVVDHLQKEKYESTESSLKQQLREAHERGDTEAWLSINDKINDIKVQRAVAAQQKPQPKQEQKPTTYRTPTAMEVAEQAAQSGEISAEELQVVDQYQGEKDENGRLLRPWAFNRSQDPRNPDPEYVQGLMEARAVFGNPRFANLSIDQKLAEVDKRMGVKKSGGSQTVMGGGLTNSKRSSKITLSPKQQEIALKTKFGGPKAKSDAEHLEAYRKQIELVSTRKGAR